MTDSLEKFVSLERVVEASGASMRPFHTAGLVILPLFGWYDYSFGDPRDELMSMWTDYQACRWPTGYDEQEIAAQFDALNVSTPPPADLVITYSHFMPRIDLMPSHGVATTGRYF